MQERQQRAVAERPAAEIGQVAVLGLWHLGTVMAGCLAAAGYEVVAVDPDESVVQDLEAGRPPVDEPGLADLLRTESGVGRLRFGSDYEDLRDSQIVWVAFDTPVDDDDRADVESVLAQAADALAHASLSALVIVSSQLPVGSVARLAERLAAAGRADLRFACIPENLRLGAALETFRSPERFVVGTSSDHDLRLIEVLLAPFGAEIVQMSVESAEMTKHALNAFLATSVAFINEVATICERVGADATEVSRGLRSERRIGPRAYLGPGEAFAGGTLARDVRFLDELARGHDTPGFLIAGVAASNQAHGHWARRTILTLLGGDESAGDGRLAGRRIAVWGLTYKPGTDTLRRSSALELCHWLAGQGAVVSAHDPAVRQIGPEYQLSLAPTALAAIDQADALVVCTPWPHYREIEAQDALGSMATPIVVDATGHLSHSFALVPGVRYARVGVAPR